MPKLSLEKPLSCDLPAVHIEDTHAHTVITSTIMYWRVDETKKNNNNNKVYSSEENSIFFNALSFQLNALKEVNLNAK